jgi:hypothetical protein
MHLCVPCVPNLIKMCGHCISGILCLIYYTSWTGLKGKLTVCLAYSENRKVKVGFKFSTEKHFTIIWERQISREVITLTFTNTDIPIFRCTYTTKITANYKLNFLNTVLEKYQVVLKQRSLSSFWGGRLCLYQTKNYRGNEEYS